MACEARGETWSADEEAAFKAPIRERYEAEGDPYFATARLWDDGIIDPAQTRDVLGPGRSARSAERADPEPTRRRVPDVSGMIESLLIANRGEIARRIIRTARRLGVRTVAVYSEADAERRTCARPTRPCRSAGAGARESYLTARRDPRRGAARRGAEAIHPGYGFLSENADFAEAVIAAGLVWVGPPPAAIRAMGLKDAAKRLMAQAGVPVTPGYLGEDQAAGAPGARGRGDRLAGADQSGGRRRRQGHAQGRRAPADFAAALAACRREAAAAFGDDRVLLEKYVDPAAPYRGAGVRRHATATSSTCSSATARCSAATRR